jgi:hypothetical protein
VIKLAIPLLSVGIDLKRTTSPTTKVQGSCHQGMAWTPIGTLIAGLLITL